MEVRDVTFKELKPLSGCVGQHAVVKPKSAVLRQFKRDVKQLRSLPFTQFDKLCDSEVVYHLIETYFTSPIFLYFVALYFDSVIVLFFLRLLIFCAFSDQRLRPSNSMFHWSKGLTSSMQV